MANQWCRLWHDMPTDPKWRTIARKSGQSIALVIAVFVQLMTSASQAEERGVYGLELEDIASSLDESEETIATVIDAMQGRVLNGSKLAGWDRRQPERDEYIDSKKTAGGGYVYTVVTTDNYGTTVAFSKNPWARIRDLNRTSPGKFSLASAFKCDEIGFEKIKELLAPARIEGNLYGCCDAINLLIQKTSSKEVTTVDQAVALLDEQSTENFVATTVETRSYGVATKDKDKDTDIKPISEEANASSSCIAADATTQIDNGNAPESVTTAKPARKRKASVTFDYDGDKRIHGITGSDLDDWTTAYPDIEVRGELLRASEWLKANPRKKKIRAFVTNWLSRAQSDSARLSQGEKDATPRTTRTNDLQDQFARLTRRRSQTQPTANAGSGATLEGEFSRM